MNSSSGGGGGVKINETSMNAQIFLFKCWAYTKYLTVHVLGLHLEEIRPMYCKPSFKFGTLYGYGMLDIDINQS